jgi:hypothetical protein
MNYFIFCPSFFIFIKNFEILLLNHVKYYEKLTAGVSF